MAKREKPPEFIDIAYYWHDQGLITLDDESLLHPMVDYGEPSCQGCGCWHTSTDFDEFKSGDDKHNKDLANHRWNYSGFEKSHIIAHGNGGSDTDPSNFLILCRSCHYDFDKEVYIDDKDELDDVYYWLRDRSQIVNKRRRRFIDKFEKDKNIKKCSNKFFIAQGLVNNSLSKDLYTHDHYLFEQEMEDVESHLKDAKVKFGSNILERQLKWHLEKSFAVMNILLDGDEFKFLDEQEFWFGIDRDKLIALLSLRKLLKDGDEVIKLIKNLRRQIKETNGLLLQLRGDLIWASIDEVVDQLIEVKKKITEDEEFLKKIYKTLKHSIPEVIEYFSERRKEEQTKLKNMENFITKHGEDSSQGQEYLKSFEKSKRYCESIETFLQESNEHLLPVGVDK